MKKTVTRELIVLMIPLIALICAAINLNSSLNQLAEKE